MRRFRDWCRVGFVFVGLAAVASTSCRPKYAPDEPVNMASEACCKRGNQEMTKFAGCRLTHRCKEDEPIWIRGAVNCTAVDEEKCFGGRCCEYQPRYGTSDSALQWDEGADEPRGGAPASSGGDATPSGPTPAGAAPAQATPTDAAPADTEMPQRM